MRTILAHCFRLAAASSRCFFQFSLAIYNQSHLGSLSQNFRVALCPCGKQEETVTLHLPWLLRSSVAVDSAQCTADNVIILLVPNWAKSRYLIHSVRTELSFFMRIVANYLRRAVFSDDDLLICISMAGASCCFLKSLLTLHPLCQASVVCGNYCRT